MLFNELIFIHAADRVSGNTTEKAAPQKSMGEFRDLGQMWLTQDLLTPVAGSITQTYEFQAANGGEELP